MNVPRTVAEVLRDHVRLETQSIDRMYLNVYVPQLQSVGGVVGYLRQHKGQRFASTAAVVPMRELSCADGPFQYLLKTCSSTDLLLFKRVGEALQGGETIATVGNSGGNFASGLYLELRHQGKSVDPMRWLARHVATAAKLGARDDP